MATTITALIAEYRRHAAAQQRMVERRNRRHLAADGPTGEALWTERALQINEKHQTDRRSISIQLQDADRQDLASALSCEAQLLARLSWSKMSGKNDVDTLAFELSAVRRDIRRMTASPVAEKVADFRRHAAALRRIDRHGSESERSQGARAEHHDACAQIAADLMSAGLHDVAFALESENNYLRRSAAYGDQLGRSLALVRRVIRRASSSSKM